MRVEVDSSGTIAGLDFPLEQGTFTAAASGPPSGFRLLHSHKPVPSDSKNEEPSASSEVKQ